jgi:beta-lactamase superfamily II metal-dependent hydrolase
MHPGQKLEERSGATLEILFAFTAKSRPKGLLDFTINDQSTVLRLTYAPTSVLFTGDLNLFTGKYLAENAAPALPATILKVPHHGTENTVPDAFFKTVGAKLAIVPSPKGLWLSERSKRIRSVLATTPTLVTEEVGNIVVTLDKDGFSHYFFK